MEVGSTAGPNCCLVTRGPFIPGTGQWLQLLGTALPSVSSFFLNYELQPAAAAASPHCRAARRPLNALAPCAVRLPCTDIIMHALFTNVFRFMW